MTSLAEVYEETSEGPELQRLYLGTGLFVAGVALSLLAILIASTGILSGFGVDVYGARKIAGVIGGVGVPGVLMGVFTVLPTSRRIKAAAAIGASICVLGVTLFWHAYPTYWVTGPGAKDMTLQVVGIYFLGLVTAGWCLFSAVVNFKTRNDPGGTVKMEVTRQGETRVVEVPRSEVSKGVGGVGMFGDTPDGDVETQTNRPDRSSEPSQPSSASRTSTDSGFGSTGRDTTTSGTFGTSGSSSRSGSEPGVGLQSSPTSDGGATTQDISSPLDENADAELLDDSPDPSQADTYCGNCAHFDYIRDRGMQPYCAHHDEVMDDMEACETWAANNSGSRGR